MTPQRVEHARVRAHLEGALLAMQGAAKAPCTRATASRRQSLQKHLRAYIDAGRYPLNEVADHATPIFVDRHGSRCAVAALLEATWRHDLVEHVARTRNLARVRELASEPALSEWLDHHGISVAEAARIQPAYHAHLQPEWRPTVSIVSSVHGGYTESVGAEATVAAGARAGIRRNVHGSDDDGYSQYGSLALTFEYARSATVQRGGTNQLAVLLQWEPTSNHRDAQWYVLGGPLASFDADDRPGSGFGGELGVGFSFRRRDVPLFAEIMTQGLVHEGTSTVRLGLQLGVVW